MYHSNSYSFFNIKNAIVNSYSLLLLSYYFIYLSLRRWARDRFGSSQLLGSFIIKCLLLLKNAEYKLNFDFWASKNNQYSSSRKVNLDQTSAINLNRVILMWPCNVATSLQSQGGGR